MKRTLSLFASLLFATSLLAQDSMVVDSLLKVLKDHSQDTVGANILYKLSSSYWGNDPERSLSYANQCLSLSTKLDFKKGMGNAYSCLGIIYWNKADYKQAHDYLDKALKIRTTINDKEGIGGSYNNIGLLYNTEGNYPFALKNFKIAEKIQTEIGFKRGLANTYDNEGNVFDNMGKYPDALKYYLDALKIKQEINDTQGMGTEYNNIGIIYNRLGNYTVALQNLNSAVSLNEKIGFKKGLANTLGNIGLVYSNMNNLSDALKNYERAQLIFEELKDKIGISTILNNIAIVYEHQGNNTEALKNYIASLKIRIELGDKYDIGSTYYNIGEFFLEHKDNEKAFRYIDTAMTIGKEIESVDLLNYCYEALAKLDSSKGNYLQAYEHYKLFISTRDTLFNQENSKKIVQQQMQFNFDLKETEERAEQDKKDAIVLKELQKQKLVRNGFIGGFAIVLFFAGIFFVQRNKIKKGKMLSDELLLNILPEEVADELKTNGSAKAKQFNEVTIMFTDFKDFTQISEKLSPSELVAEIHTCFKAFDNIISKYNIEKIKTIGDSYMCAGGLPVANSTNAMDVVNAALEIQKFMQQHVLQRRAEGKEQFEIRIGIHTGPVVAGIVGVKKYAYDIWGDTVNIASRMESSGEAGKINISESTYNLIKDLPVNLKDKQSNKFVFIHRGKIMAKNKGEIEMYFVEPVDAI